MKRLSALVVLLLAGFPFSAGCANLSLFSSTHSHYHGTQAIDERLTSLEARVAALEAGGVSQSPGAPPVPVYPPVK